jgi:hypothetical protein
MAPPSHRSSTSQPPAAGRHTSPTGRPAQSALAQSSAHTPLQQDSPIAHVLARSQRPPTHVAVSHGPATQVVSSHEPASRPCASSPDASSRGASTEASRAPASRSLPAATQPIDGTQTSDAAQPSPLVSRQTPATHEGATQAALAVHCAGVVHCGRGHSGSLPVTQRGLTHSPPTQVSPLSHITPSHVRAMTTFTIWLPVNSIETRRDASCRSPSQSDTSTSRRPSRSPA